MNFSKLLVEALIFLAIGIAASVVVRAVVSQWSRRGFARNYVTTTSISAVTTLLLAELWTQFAQQQRLSRVTLGICVLLSAAATVAQSRDDRDLSRFRA